MAHRLRYDLNDNLFTTDSQNNEKWFRYDGLKRKLFMNARRGRYDLHLTTTLELTEPPTPSAHLVHLRRREPHSHRELSRQLFACMAPLNPNPQLSTPFSVIYHYTRLSEPAQGDQVRTAAT